MSSLSVSAPLPPTLAQKLTFSSQPSRANGLAGAASPPPSRGPSESTTSDSSALMDASSSTSSAKPSVPRKSSSSPRSSGTLSSSRESQELVQGARPPIAETCTNCFFRLHPATALLVPSRSTKTARVASTSRAPPFVTNACRPSEYGSRLVFCRDGFLTPPTFLRRREDFSACQLGIKTLGEEDFDKKGQRKIRQSCSRALPLL